MKPSNEVLKEYLKLEEQVEANQKKMKPILDRMAEIKEAAAKIGSYATKECVVIVSTYQRTWLLGLKEVAAVVGQNVLEENGLIAQKEYSTTKIVKKN